MIRKDTQTRLSVTRLGQPREPFADVYHFVHRLEWWALFLLFTIVFIGLNLVFATLYGFGGDCIVGADPNSFEDRFFFSVQSLTTIGYGVMSPGTTFANALVAFESFLGLFSTALMTGIIFAKFSLPKSRVLFSNNALLTKRDGGPVLIFRMANGRGNSLVSVELEATLIITDKTAEGEKTRRIQPLKLANQKVPILTISVTGIHRIDEESPLHGLTTEDLKERDALVAVNISGLDDTIGQPLHAQHFYRAGDFREGKKFVDVLTMTRVGDEVQYTMDYTQFHDIEDLPK